MTNPPGYMRSYRNTNRESLLIKRRSYAERVKREGIAAYGGVCTCCGEDRIEFLTLDHLNGRRRGGRKADRPGVTGKKLWAALRTLGWPKYGYTLRCWNCNCARAIYGTCPHQNKRRTVEIAFPEVVAA